MALQLKVMDKIEWLLSRETILPLTVSVYVQYDLYVAYNVNKRHL